MHSVYTEGKDEIFIRDYLTYLFGDKWKSKAEIRHVGGWNNLSKITNELEKTTSAGFKNFVIFDADTVMNNGGFAKRKEDIEKIKTQEIVFELFLFPNNQLDGDFENLLEKIINQEHEGLLDCFSKYERCISQYKDSNSNQLYITPARKARMYSYIDAFPKSKSQKEEFKNGNYFFLNPEYWNLNHSFLDTLKEFLVEIVK
jgi:hypothetical protein